MKIYVKPAMDVLETSLEGMLLEISELPFDPNADPAVPDSKEDFDLEGIFE